jgi:hypothetical protein
MFQVREECYMSRECPSGGGGGSSAAAHVHVSNAVTRMPKWWREFWWWITRLLQVWIGRPYVTRMPIWWSGGGGGGGHSCLNCGEEGHMSRSAPIRRIQTSFVHHVETTVVVVAAHSEVAAHLRRRKFIKRRLGNQAANFREKINIRSNSRILIQPRSRVMKCTSETRDGGLRFIS